MLLLINLVLLICPPTFLTFYITLCPKDRPFITGVIKVQTGRESLLNNDEKRSLLKAGGLLPEDDSEEDDELLTPTESTGVSYKDALKRKRAERIKGFKSRYHPAIKKAVPCSAAEVERIWSRARHVLTRERSSMAPIIFEAIMFLKYNRRLWGLAEVVEVNKRRRGHCPRIATRVATRERVVADLAAVNAWEAVVTEALV